MYVQIYRNNRNGCHLADCDYPFCDNIAWVSERMNMCSKPSQITHNPCYSLVLSRNINIVRPICNSSGAKKQQDCPKEREMYGSFNKHLPICNSSSAAVSYGRWLSPSIVVSNNATIFGDISWPLIWQPFDCELRWLDSKSLISCFARTDVIVVGMSRERTTFFDFFDFLNRSIHYEKVRSVSLYLLFSTLCKHTISVYIGRIYPSIIL